MKNVSLFNETYLTILNVIAAGSIFTGVKCQFNFIYPRVLYLTINNTIKKNKLFAVNGRNQNLSMVKLDTNGCFLK